MNVKKRNRNVGILCNVDDFIRPPWNQMSEMYSVKSGVS